MKEYGGRTREGRGTREEVGRKKKGKVLSTENDELNWMEEAMRKGKGGGTDGEKERERRGDETLKKNGEYRARDGQI